MRDSCRSLQASVQIFTRIALSICKRLHFSHWKCWALFFCLFYAVSLTQLGKYSFASVTVQPVWGTKKRKHLCCVSSHFAVTNSSLFGNIGYHTVAFRLCETVWSGIFRLEVTIRVTKDGRSFRLWCSTPNPPPPTPCVPWPNISLKI